MTTVALTGEEVRSRRFWNGTQVNPNESTAFAIGIIVAVLVVDVAAFLASFFGLVTVAQWMLLSGWKVVLLPLVVDGAIVVFTLAASVYRARGVATFLLWSFVAFFTLLSVGANALHVISTSPNGTNPIHVGVGAFMAGVMPAAVWAVTHVLVNLVIEKDVAKKADVEKPVKPVRQVADAKQSKIEAVPELIYRDLDTSK